MKKLICVLLLFVLSVCAVSASAQTVSFADSEYSTDLEAIDFGDTAVTLDKLIPFLEQMPMLKQVDMFSTVIEAADADRLASLFPDISFGWTIHLLRKHYIRTDQTAFSTLHGDCDGHFARHFAALKYCKNLKALDLGHNYIEDLSFLEGLTDLRVLILACNEFTDISVLASMPKLEYLELFTNRIQADLSPLSGLTRLLDLNISNCYKVTDVSPLYGLKQLKRLWMTHTHVELTNKTVQDIQSALPDTEINFDAVNPTAGGWRKHPHQAVIDEMFQTGIYIPFEDSYPD